MRWCLALTLFLASACQKGFTPIVDAEVAVDQIVAAGDRSADRAHDAGPTSRERSTVDGPPLPSCPGPIISEDVDTYHDPGQYPSIAVDAKGDLHISQLSAGEPYDMFGNGGWWDARYAARRSGGWKTEDIATGGVVGAFGALGLGPSGEVHVVYYKDGDRDLLYSRRDSVGWKLPEKILSQGDGGWANDLAVDPGGSVHVVTFSRPSSMNNQVVYLRRVGSSWAAPVVLEPSTYDGGAKNGIAVQTDGTVHTCFEDDAGQLKYRRGKDGIFQAALILDSGVGAGACDVALDGNGDAQVSYHDGTKKVLRFIGQTGSIFGSPITLDSNGVVGSFHRIVAGTGNDLWIAYYDFTNLDLKLIRRQGTSWGPPQTIDSAGHVGRHASAAVGPDGAVHIAHWNETTRALRYTRVCP